MTGGLAFEGLNNVSSYPNDLLVVVNDNNMSIDANVGGLNKYLVDLNTSHAYNTIRYDLYRGLRQMNLMNDRRKRNIQRINNSVSHSGRKTTPPSLTVSGFVTSAPSTDMT